ncbi:MAG: DUF4349 domain-containing protein [Chitinophagaceae bacterium]|jgi:hypothetical protein|nr:DUF4349 domain-containing protein [Chitinophagaceae bacterium]
MKLSAIFLALGFTSLLLSCGSNSEKPLEEGKMKLALAAADSTTVMASSSAAVVNQKDTVHKFIRTADLKFKVKNVYTATQTIEDITNQLGGFVTYTKLNSNINNQTTTAISADSSLVTTYYTMVNSVVLRVPNTQLDTTLKAIATLIDFLDYRIIKADDVALQLLANKLAKNRLSKSEQRLADAIDNRGKKLQETTNAEDVLSNKQEQRDNATLSNLSLQDQINFSTVNLSIYQNQAVKREVISNNKNIAEYTPGMSSKLLDALKSGWLVMQTIIVFVVNIWPLILLIAIGFFLYKRYGNRLKNK